MLQSPRRTAKRGADRHLLALALQRLPFLRSDEKLLLWDVIDDAESLSLLSLSDVGSIVGRGLEGREWRPARLVAEAEADSRLLERIGARHLQYDAAEYPPQLRETARPPFGLYARGEGLDPERPAAAVVGTRYPTGRGLGAAWSLCRGLALEGVPVVSGLARGIDAQAHRGAMAGGGATCAVLACGIDGVYPPGHRELAAAMLDSGGLLVSEYAPGEAIHKYRFPERNRIIAGLARACVVVEAPAASGALITAEHALGENRDVWVSRACLGGPRSAGIDRLAEEGAPALDGAEELLRDWRGEGAAPFRDDDSRVRSPARPGGGVGASGADAGRRAAEAMRLELGLDSSIGSGDGPPRG